MSHPRNKPRFFARLATLACMVVASCAPNLVQAQETEPPHPTPPFKLDDSRLREISGVAVSHRNPGIFWMNNDSGDTARLFAVNSSGKVAMVVNLDGIEATDWEDVALAGDWVYAADCGDNFAVRENIKLYRFREPEINANATGKEVTLKGAQFESMVLHFPDGPRDCESCAVTPDGHLLFVSKQADGSRFYTLDNAFQDKTTASLRKFGEYKFGATGYLTKLATGADLAPDGRHLAVTTYAQIYQFPLTEPFNFTSLQWTPTVLTLPPLRQCEGIGYSPDGKELWVTSEGKNQPVYELNAETGDLINTPATPEAAPTAGKTE